jgi:hypothetical protein
MVAATARKWNFQAIFLTDN